MIQFAPDPNGFDKAVQLSNYFEKQSRSRDAWEAHGSRSKRFDDDGKLLVFGYLAQPKDMWQVRECTAFSHQLLFSGFLSSVTYVTRSDWNKV